jgi:hypothetical protein
VTTASIQEDRRYELFYERLHGLTIEQLRRLIDYRDDIVCDTYNYDGRRFCALAVALDIPKLMAGRTLTQDTVRAKIVEIASRQIPGFLINPTKGVSGTFYTTNRKEDLLTLARQVLNEKERSERPNAH